VAPPPVLEKLNLGKQGADLCSSPVTQMFVAAYFGERDGRGGPIWLDYVGGLRELYRTRRDAMLEALEEHLGGRGRWTTPSGGLFVWATLDGGIDTTDLLARSEGVAFVPGRAAYVDGRSGSSSMRLNFAGSTEQEIREGLRRIARALGPDTGLLGALTGSRGAGGSRSGTGSSAGGEAGGQSDGEQSPQTGPRTPAGEMADVIELPRPQEGRAPRRVKDR